MIRVCMILHQYYYRDSRLRRYCETLAAAGAQVDVLCLRDPDQPATGEKPGIRVLALPFGRSQGGAGRYLIHFALAFVLYSAWLSLLSMRHRYQIIHAHNMPDTLVFAALIPRLLGAKLILDVHDPMPEFYRSKSHAPSDSLPVRLATVQEKVAAQLADAVITANGNFKHNMVARGTPAAKITVINNLPDGQIFNRSAYTNAMRAERTDFTLIYPGTVAPRYGLDLAIRALPQLTERIPNLYLLIMGAGQPEYLEQLGRLATDLGVASSVRFKAPVPVDQVPSYMAQADVGIYPALPDGHMNIATPSKVLEYATMGLPIVASRLSVLEDLFGARAILFHEPGNADQFARCVVELYERPALRQELVANCDATFVSTHSWDREQRVYIDLLNRLLGFPALSGWKTVAKEIE